MKTVRMKRAHKILGDMISLCDEIKKAKNSDERRNALKGLPSIILSMGLGQTVAFFACRDKDKDFYAKVVQILCKATFDQEAKPDAFLKKIVAMDIYQYHHVQAEAVEYASWMKRYALAFVPEKAKEQVKERG